MRARCADPSLRRRVKSPVRHGTDGEIGIFAFPARKPGCWRMTGEIRVKDTTLMAARMIECDQFRSMIFAAAVLVLFAAAARA